MMYYVYSVKRSLRGRQFRWISYHGNGEWTFCYFIGPSGIIDDLVDFFIRSWNSIAIVDVSHGVATSEPFILRDRVHLAAITYLGFRGWGFCYVYYFPYTWLILCALIIVFEILYMRCHRCPLFSRSSLLPLFCYHCFLKMIFPCCLLWIWNWKCNRFPKHHFSIAVNYLWILCLMHSLQSGNGDRKWRFEVGAIETLEV